MTDKSELKLAEGSRWGDGSPEFARFNAVVDGVWGWNHLNHVVWTSHDRCKIWPYEPTLATFDYNHLTRLVVLAHEHKVRAEVMATRRNGLCVALQLRGEPDSDPLSSWHPSLERHVAAIRGYFGGNGRAYQEMYDEVRNG